MHYEKYSLLKGPVLSYAYYLLATESSNVNLIYSQYKNSDFLKEL